MIKSCQYYCPIILHQIRVSDWFRQKLAGTLIIELNQTLVQYYNVNIKITYRNGNGNELNKVWILQTNKLVAYKNKSTSITVLKPHSAIFFISWGESLTYIQHKMHIFAVSFKLCFPKKHHNHYKTNKVGKYLTWYPSCWNLFYMKKKTFHTFSFNKVHMVKPAKQRFFFCWL